MQKVSVWSAAFKTLTIDELPHVCRKAHLSAEGQVSDGHVIDKDVELLGPQRQALTHLRTSRNCNQSSQSLSLACCQLPAVAMTRWQAVEWS